MMTSDDERRNRLRGTNARQVIVDELADMQATVTLRAEGGGAVITDEERREIARELRRCAVYGEDETLLGWWERLHFIATGDDDFIDMRSLFMRLAGLIDGSACADEQSEEVESMYR